MVFLGSGKTTAIQSAIRVLGDQGVKCGVITNDQGIRLVVADLLSKVILSRLIISDNNYEFSKISW